MFSEKNSQITEWHHLTVYEVEELEQCCELLWTCLLVRKL